MPQRRDKCRSSFTRNSKDVKDNPWPTWVNVFENPVLNTKAEGLNAEHKSMGWHLFEKSNLTLERQERVLGAPEGEYEFAAIRGALINLFPDTIISQEKTSVPDRKPGHCDGLENELTDHKNRFTQTS